MSGGLEHHLINIMLEWRQAQTASMGGYVLYRGAATFLSVPSNKAVSLRSQAQTPGRDEIKLLQV